MDWLRRKGRDDNTPEPSLAILTRRILAGRALALARDSPATYRACALPDSEPLRDCRCSRFLGYFFGGGLLPARERIRDQASGLAPD